MRFSVLPLLLAGASVVGLVAAEPIRVVESPFNENANIRFGHALANANVNGNDDNVARIVRPVALMGLPLEGKKKGFTHHFCGASLREKALRVSNAFRHALGMPLIEADAAVPMPVQVHILPVDYPSQSAILDEDGDERKHHHHGHHRGHHVSDEDHERHSHHGHHGRHSMHHKSFLRRIHRAIKALGPWEGRAVAFVLGCGIGVLLRMFWVLSVLAYRTVRGERSEETFEREYVVYEQVPETLFVAPPQYVDEKVSMEANEEIEEHK